MSELLYLGFRWIAASLTLAVASPIVDKGRPPCSDNGDPCISGILYGVARPPIGADMGGVDPPTGMTGHLDWTSRNAKEGGALICQPNCDPSPRTIRQAAREADPFDFLVQERIGPGVNSFSR